MIVGLGRMKMHSVSGSRGRRFACWMTALAVSISSTAFTLGVRADTGPDSMTSVKTVIDQAIGVFKDPAFAPAQREQKLRAIAESHFDFQSMARSAVGYHWRDLTPEQRKEFVPLFTAFIEDVYLSRIEQYSVEKVNEGIESSNVQFVRERIDSSDDAQVFSTVTLKDRNQPLQVNYLLKRNGEEWRIYDITIDAISVIANYRNQFNRVINEGGYDKLAGIIRQKQQSLSTSMAR